MQGKLSDQSINATSSGRNSSSSNSSTYPALQHGRVVHGRWREAYRRGPWDWPVWTAQSAQAIRNVAIDSMLRASSKACSVRSRHGLPQAEVSGHGHGRPWSRSKSTLAPRSAVSKLSAARRNLSQVATAPPPSKQHAAHELEPPRPPQASWQYVLSLLTIAEGALEVSHSLLLEQYAGREAIAAHLKSASPPRPPLGATYPQLEEKTRQPVGAPAAPGPLQLVPAAEAAAVDAAEVEANDMAAMSLEELRAAVQQTRSAAGALTVQLAELQSSARARLPEGQRGEVEGMLASIDRLEDELSSLWKGDEAAASLEQQRQELHWELFGLLKPHASEDDVGGYGSLLASLSLQRQLLLALEARQCVAELETELSAQQALLAGAQQLGPAALPAQLAADSMAPKAQQAVQGPDLQAGEGDGKPGGGRGLTAPEAEQAAGLPAAPAANAEFDQTSGRVVLDAGAGAELAQQAEQGRPMPAQQAPVEPAVVSAEGDFGAVIAVEERLSTKAQQASADLRGPQGPARAVHVAAEEVAAQPSLTESDTDLVNEAKQEGEQQQAELQLQTSAEASQEQPERTAGAPPAPTGTETQAAEDSGELAAAQDPPETGLEVAHAAVTDVPPPPAVDRPAVSAESTQDAQLPLPPSLSPSASSINSASLLPVPTTTPADPDTVPTEPRSSRPVPQLRLVAAGCMIPHPDKAETGGEDAFFVSRQGCGAVGVADGVGGWAAEGIDPALYPRELLAACQDGLEHHAEDPSQLLHHAHQHAHAPGSCTVCLAAMQGDGALKVVSLGDCGVVVLRPGEGVVFRGEVQEHEFNMPYQIASPRFLPISNQPEEAQQYEVAVQPGDVVLLGSDGLFDNLWEHEMEELVQWQLQDLDSSAASSLDHAAHALAAELAQRAHQHSQDATYRSPFAVERHERVVHPFVRSITKPLGGKLDDITCVAALLGY